MSKFEKEVRKKLIDLEMTIPELAKEIDISFQYIYDIFKGNRKADKQKGKIIQFLGLQESLMSDD